MVINKKELVKRVSKATDYMQEDVSSVVDAIIDIIKNAVLEGDDVNLWGFMTISTKTVAEREGHDFKTGKRIVIPSHPKIKVSVADAWNKQLSE